MLRVLLLSLFVASAFSQACTTTDALNVRSGAGTGFSVLRTLPTGSRVTLLNGQTHRANGHTWAPIGNGQWVAKTFLNCNGGSSPAPPAPTPSGGGGSLSSYPTSYSTSGYTYTGKRAQTLHFLKARFTASATTYASHSDGALSSADLWTQGAAYSKDNSGIASMNQLADYVAANLGSLGVRYVIWKQRINLGSGWRQMENRGSITQNHFDHVHITFESSWRATTDPASTLTQASTPADPMPGWAVGILILNFVVLAAIGALVVVVVRATSRRDVRE